MTTMTAAGAVTRVLRAVLYLRISKDKAGDEHGVTNQRGDAVRLAASRGYDISAVYCDNDISAFSGARRPDYERMMAAAARSEFDVIVVFQTSRLWRTRGERAAGIKILQAAGISVIATKGPSLDMSTAYGRAMAGLLGEFDTLEVEVKAERQQLAYQAQRDAGIRHGGPAHFGSTAAERDAIRWAADALLGGSTVSAVTREWERRGLRPPQAPFGPLPRGAWKRNSVTTILRNPAVAGLRAYSQRIQRDGKTRLVRTIVTDERGEPVRGRWDAALTEDQWRAVAALLDAPGRKPQQGVRTLLGGLARCRCGNTVLGSVNATGKHVYRCGPATRGGRPGPHCQQMAASVDNYVERVIVERLSRDDITDLITPPAAVDAAALHREAAAIRANLKQSAADAMLGLIGRDEHLCASAAGRRRLDEITAELAESAAGSALAPFATGKAAREVWDGLDRPRKSAVIGALCTVTIAPAGRGARIFDPDTVTFDPVTGGQP
jgi:DNA invertase Pin-like site-specific DNA recombinase